MLVGMMAQFTGILLYVGSAPHTELGLQELWQDYDVPACVHLGKESYCKYYRTERFNMLIKA